MSLPHLPTSADFHQDIILHIQEVHQWRVRLMHNLILVWFLSSFQLRGSQYGAYSQQRCKHQYCCAWDCILQILFSSYQISLSLNQSFVAKIRSISISSPCHFYSVLYCVILFYRIFLVSAAASVGTEQRSTGPLVVFASLRSVQSGHPPDVLHPCICPYQSS